MNTTPDTDEFGVAVPELHAVVAPLTGRLLADKILLLFDVETGVLVSGNDNAVMQLGLDMENPIQPSFAEVVGAEIADRDWPLLSAGEDCQWTGTVTGALGLSVSGAVVAIPHAEIDAVSHVLLQITPAEVTEGPVVDTPAGGLAYASEIDTAVGTIVYDMDGNIMALNGRAMSALEDYGEELVGRNHETLWPKSATEAESYIEFWEKLRQGRTVEGRHKHLTAVESEVWFHSIFVPVKAANGHTEKVVQCLMDVSESAYVAEKALEQTDAIKSHVALCEFDAEGHIASINEVLASALGRDVEEL
ncbi:MAG: PAS domain-containing protein, partial [Pseudomonadota bacterium]